jgi:hypothetical protein
MRFAFLALASLRFLLFLLTSQLNLSKADQNTACHPCHINVTRVLVVMGHAIRTHSLFAKGTGEGDSRSFTAQGLRPSGECVIHAWPFFCLASDSVIMTYKFTVNRNVSIAPLVLHRLLLDSGRRCVLSTLQPSSFNGGYQQLRSGDVDPRSLLSLPNCHCRRAHRGWHPLRNRRRGDHGRFLDQYLAAMDPHRNELDRVMRTCDREPKR